MRLNGLRAGASLWILALLSASAAAGNPAAADKVMQHYRAYRTALEQQDLQLAETEAGSALAASVELYGDAGRTGVLAVNLAGVRLALKQNAAAIEPARRALAIAEVQGEESGVDVRVARLLLGRAELPEGGEAAMDRLMESVAAAQGVEGVDDEAYPAAVELAAAAFDAEAYELSRDAWIASARFAGGSRVNVDYARARAKVGEASAAIMMRATDRPAGSRAAQLAQFAPIDQTLAEAMDIIHDQAMQSEMGGELTLAQAVFGQALAWKYALKAKLVSEGRALPNPAKPQKEGTEIRPADDPRPSCDARTVGEPRPVFPPAQRVIGGVGSVALKILTDDDGKVTRAQVAGSVGGEAFKDSVVVAARQWHLEKLNSSVPGCRMAREYFMISSFAYR